MRCSNHEWPLELYSVSLDARRIYKYNLLHGNSYGKWRATCKRSYDHFCTSICSSRAFEETHGKSIHARPQHVPSKKVDWLRIGLEVPGLWASNKSGSRSVLWLLLNRNGLPRRRQYHRSSVVLADAANAVHGQPATADGIPTLRSKHSQLS